MKPSGNHSNGFTLVELLIAMAISSIIAAAIFTAFKSQQDSYLVQEQVAEMQQNLRAAMTMLSRDVRMAGYGFSSGQVSWYDGSSTQYIKGIEIIDNNPDQINILYADPSVDATITQPMPNSSAELNVDKTDGFEVGDLIIITDGTNGSILEITQVQDSALKLQHNPGSSPFNPPGGHNIFPPEGYGTGSHVCKVRWVSYRIDNTTDPSHPRLEINLGGPNGAGAYQPLAENIEDLELVYLFANGSEGTSWDETDTNPDNDYDDIRAVRINLLARSDRVDKNFSGIRPSIENHPGGSPDNYRRRLLTTTIKCRNLGL